MNKKFLLLISFVALTFFGCATSTHFTKLPTPHEFKKPLQQLKEEYPDLTRYEEIHLFDTIFRLLEAGPLELTLGEPHSTGFSSWMLWPPTWLIDPREYWFWEFNGKRVSALVNRPLAFGYQPHVSTLKVEEIVK